MEITVKLTATEEMALSYIAIDPLGYVTDGVRVSIQRAIDEIVALEVQRKLQLGESIPGSRDAIVQEAFAQGWIQSAGQRMEQMNAAAQFEGLEGIQP